MPSFDDVSARAVAGSPFSNSTEGGAWQSGWCWREGAFCRHDTIDRGGDLCCPLMDVAILGRTPAEWGERRNVLGPGMYECSRYEADPDQ